MNEFLQDFFGEHSATLSYDGLFTRFGPAQLKDKVCSPGGTTIQGVAALEENGFRNALIKATDACFEACSKNR